MPDFSENVEEDKNRKNANLPYLVLALSIFITFAVTYNFYQNALAKDSIRFTNEIGRIQSAIENKVNLYVALLKGGRGFIESSEDLTRDKFAKYVENLEIDKNYAGVQGIGYSKVVPADDLDDLTGQMEAQGYADFRVFPESEKDLYEVVAYLEPQNEINRKAVGFDMLSEANRRNASEQARDSGLPAASAKVNLFDADEKNAANGFFIFLPIYQPGKIPASLEGRRKNLSGFIFGSFRANDFLSEIQKTTTTYDIAIKIYDAENKKENLLAQTVLNQSKDFSDNTGENYASSKAVDIADRKWIVEYSALPSFAERSSVGWTILIFLSGIFFSFLLFGITYWEISARATLQRTAAELFELQKQKQILLEKEQKARLSAERANRTKDEFIAVVSHELRTPLNAIAGWTNILKTDNLSSGTKKLALEKIEKNLRSQTNLVEELLDYSQIVSGAINLDGKNLNFSDVFENIFREFEPKAREKSIELVKDNRLNGQMILGDDEKIRLVIQNLLSNAVKFTQSGGKINAVASENDGVIQLSIEDTGKGISPEFLPFIFEHFRQSDNSSTRIYGGLGLGLAISNHIVRLHNGTIEADSAGKDKGAVFTIKLPLLVHNS